MKGDKVMIIKQVASRFCFALILVVLASGSVQAQQNSMKEGVVGACR